MELNGVSTAGQTVAECKKFFCYNFSFIKVHLYKFLVEKNLKLSGNRIRIRLKSGIALFLYS